MKTKTTSIMATLDAKNEATIYKYGPLGIIDLELVSSDNQYLVFKIIQCSSSEMGFECDPFEAPSNHVVMNTITKKNEVIMVPYGDIKIDLAKKVYTLRLLKEYKESCDKGTNNCWFGEKLNWVPEGEVMENPLP